MENIEPTVKVEHENFAGAGNAQNVDSGFSARQIHARETLAKSQKRFRYAFLTSPDSVAIIRAKDEVYTEINEMFSLFLGYAKKDIVGRKFTEVAAWRN